MQKEEEKHLAEFERLMSEKRVRPTVLLPLWNIAGFALGILIVVCVSFMSAVVCGSVVSWGEA